jgi:hypothetical protein
VFLVFLIDSNLPYIAQFFLFFLVVILFVPSVIFTGTATIVLYLWYVLMTLLGWFIAPTLAVYIAYFVIYTLILFFLDKEFTDDLHVAIKGSAPYKRIRHEWYIFTKLGFLLLWLVLLISDIIKSFMLRQVQLSLLQSLAVVLITLVLIRWNK